ncbi:Lipid phosphate phosphatase 1 [Mycena indigotica]|uniref:Lipid phosphate phosphatase 1 n=1 Tax=Mycena indigotica TaxID=2126181 RepID=A0A8H6WCM8_9AGAR|nr:Lipid phosphate phosphatase 1 [Mycena indigotica]KAF7309903.1 Lipid phosphate phosphatase 1 [Mycena indigotica]
MSLHWQRRIKRIFGSDALDWVDRSYLTDWIVVAAFWGLSELAGRITVFERDFYPTDPIINHPHKKNQISGSSNHLIALLVPGAAVLATSLYQLSFVSLHHGLLALLAARGMTRLFTNILKNKVGRLRPDFLSRCKWDTEKLKCTGKADNILDGRRSFPSGHSSAAFAGMTFLAFWLAGQTAAWCFQAQLPAASLRSSRLARFCFTLLPIWWAIYVGVTRVEDYRHHKEDVIVGGLMGIICASISYLAFWPSPFSESSFQPYTYGQPRTLSSSDTVLYSQSDSRRRTEADFELSRLEESDLDV